MRKDLNRGSRLLPSLESRHSRSPRPLWQHFSRQWVTVRLENLDLAVTYLQFLIPVSLSATVVHLNSLWAVVIFLWPWTLTYDHDLEIDRLDNANIKQRAKVKVRCLDARQTCTRNRLLYLDHYMCSVNIRLWKSNAFRNQYTGYAGTNYVDDFVNSQWCRPMGHRIYTFCPCIIYRPGYAARILSSVKSLCINSSYIFITLQKLEALSQCISPPRYVLPVPPSCESVGLWAADLCPLTTFSERELTFTFAICCRPSVCLSSVSLPVVCLSVTFVRPIQAVQIFGNITTALGTLAIFWHPLKILWRSSKRNPSAGEVKHKRGSKI